MHCHHFSREAIRYISHSGLLLIGFLFFCAVFVINFSKGLMVSGETTGSRYGEGFSSFPKELEKSKTPITTIDWY